MLEVVRQFRVLVLAMKAHYRQLETRAGIGGAYVWALADIAAEPGLSVGELARKMALHLSTVSNLIRRLEDEGLVVRAREDEDQRVVRLTATARGRRLLAKAPKPLVGVLQEALRDLPPARLRSLHRELEFLIARMRATGMIEADDRTPLAEILSRPKTRAR